MGGSSHTHKSRTQPRRLLVVTFGVLAPTAVSIRSIFQGSRHAEKLINTHSSGIDKWNYIWGCHAGYGEAQQFKVCFFPFFVLFFPSWLFLFLRSFVVIRFESMTEYYDTYDILLFSRFIRLSIILALGKARFG